MADPDDSLLQSMNNQGLGSAPLDNSLTPQFYKGQPSLRVWQLHANSTRYDRLSAAPSDANLHAYWSIWVALTTAVALFTTVVFLGLLSNRRARRNAFNCYLLYLMIPDMLFSWLCGLTCLLNALQGHYVSAAWMCDFQAWYCVFGIGANAWLNAVVALQIHKMLRYGHARRRYHSPSRARVTCHAAGVYLWAALLGLWGLAPGGHVGATSGLACLPMEGPSDASMLVFWGVFFPLFCGIPVLVVLYVCLDVWIQGTMPPSGKRRLLTIYFGRLVVVFLVMWIPTLLLIFMLDVLPWARFMGGTWSHLQGAVSAAVTLMKPDVRAAVVQFVTGQSCSQNVIPEYEDHPEDDPPSDQQQQQRRRLDRSGSWFRGSWWSSQYSLRNSACNSSNKTMDDRASAKLQLEQPPMAEIVASSLTESANVLPFDDNENGNDDDLGMVEMVDAGDAEDPKERLPEEEGTAQGGT